MEFVPYKSFADKDHARAFQDILMEHNIPFELAEERQNLDSTLGGKHFSQTFFLKLRKTDFMKADDVVAKASDIDIHEVDKEYYLFTFSDEELLEVLQKRDEWSSFDFLLAQKILKQRGKEVPSAGLDILREKRIKELAVPEDSSTFLVYTGYIFSLMGGVFGLLIGWHILTYRKTLPDGTQVYGYSAKNRNQGKFLMYAGAVATALFIILVLSNLHPL